MDNNPVFYTLASSLPYARLLTLLVELSGAAGSPKHVYNLRKPEKVRFAKFWRVYCFGLNTRVTGPFPIFQLIPTYEVTSVLHDIYIYIWKSPLTITSCAGYMYVHVCILGSTFKCCVSHLWQLYIG